LCKNRPLTLLLLYLQWYFTTQWINQTNFIGTEINFIVFLFQIFSVTCLSCTVYQTKYVAMCVPFIFGFVLFCMSVLGICLRGQTWAMWGIYFLKIMFYSILIETVGGFHKSWAQGLKRRAHRKSGRRCKKLSAWCKCKMPY
jgi:hypothetical protein